MRFHTSCTPGPLIVIQKLVRMLVPKLGSSYVFLPLISRMRSFVTRFHTGTENSRGAYVRHPPPNMTNPPGISVKTNWLEQISTILGNPLSFDCHSVVQKLLYNLKIPRNWRSKLETDQRQLQLATQVHQGHPNHTMLSPLDAPGSGAQNRSSVRLQKWRYPHTTHELGSTNHL